MSNGGPMRRLVLLVAAACTVASAVAACAPQSAVDPNATVHVTGQAYAVGGAPLATRPVKLGSGVPGDDVAVVAFSGGLLCATGLCSGTVRSGSTDASGRYDLTVKGSATQGTLGTAKTELVTVSGEPTGQQVSGPIASARFYIQTTTVAVPALRLIDPSLAVSGASARLTATWKTTGPPADTLTFADRAGAEVWSAPVHGTTASLDGRVLEATQGRVLLTGGASDAITGSQVSLRWTGPGLAYASGSGPPSSRGGSCTYSATATAAAVVMAACPLTDGDLTTRAATETVCATPATKTAPATDCTSADEVTVSLRSPAAADLLVVRGCTETCPVSVSADGRSFTPTGSVSGDDATLTLPGTTISAVRLGGLATADLREVSVWAPARAPALGPVDDRLSAALRGPFVPTHRGHPRLRAVLLVVTSVALAGMVLGLGIAIGTHRRRRVPG